jgi:hypothetical protein
MTGYSNSFSENNDVYVLNIDGDGEVLFQGNYGSALDAERMYGSAPTADGGLIATGILDYYYQLQDDLFVLKLGPDDIGYEEINSDPSSFSVYPNPSGDRITIQIKSERNSKVDITLLDAFGRGIKTIACTNMGEGLHQIPVDCSEMEPGIYTCLVEMNHRKLFTKIIKTR